MKLVAYREFRPHEELSSKAQKFYTRLGITESFLRDIEYAGPHESAWALMARKQVGKSFSARLRAELKANGIDAEIEERSKRLNRIYNKLMRHNRSIGLEPSPLLKAL